MKRWQLWLGIVISLGCIAYVVLRIDNWDQFGRAFVEARYIYLIPIIASYFLIMFLRAVRWRYILNHCGHASLRNSFTSILVCYMGNNVFPLRAGELMRVFLIGKQEKSVSYSAALATVVVERLFDFMSMLIFLAAVLMLVEFPPERLMVTIGDGQVDLQGVIHSFGAATLAGALVLFAFLVLLNAFTDRVLGISARILKILPRDWGDKLLGALERFSGGLAIMGRPASLFALTGMSVVIWTVNLLPVWLSGLAFNIEIDFSGCMFMLVVGSAAASIPGPPGFFGTFHAFNQEGLVFLLGVGRGMALSFAIVLHACYYFPLVIAGAAAAWKEGYSLTRLREEAGEIKPDQPGPDCKA